MEFAINLYEGNETHLLCFSKGLFLVSSAVAPQKLFKEDLFFLLIRVLTVFSRSESSFLAEGLVSVIKCLFFPLGKRKEKCKFLSVTSREVAGSFGIQS